MAGEGRVPPTRAASSTGPEAEPSARRPEATSAVHARLTTEVVCRLGADGRFTNVSPAVEFVLGHRPADLLGGPASALCHPEDLLAWPESHPADGQVLSGRLRVRHSNRTWRWMETRSRCLGDGPEGQPELLVIARDITEQVELETTLRRSEAGYRQLVKRPPRASRGSTWRASSSTSTNDTPRSWAASPMTFWGGTSPSSSIPRRRRCSRVGASGGARASASGSRCRSSGPTESRSGRWSPAARCRTRRATCAER